VTKAAKQAETTHESKTDQIQVNGRRLKLLGSSESEIRLELSDGEGNTSSLGFSL